MVEREGRNSWSRRLFIVGLGLVGERFCCGQPSIAMAGRGGNFIARVMQYVVNELLVDRLANNQNFQRFAVRSSKAIEELAEKGAQKKAELAEQMKEITETFSNEISKSLKDGGPPDKRRH